MQHGVVRVRIAADVEHEPGRAISKPAEVAVIIIRKLKQELEQTSKRVRTIQILDELIEPMANRSFWFMCIYCFVVAVMLALDGFEQVAFNLPDSVLEFLVGSTAATVIGLVGMVLTGIFIGARRNHD